MRYLTIVRHAKAANPLPGESDYDRILTKRGVEQCASLRQWASDAEQLGKYGPTTALVSSAARTKETFERSFAGTDFVGPVYFSDRIYNGRRDVSADDVLIDLAAIDPVTTSLLVVCHNPTVTELMYRFTRTMPPSMHDGYPLAGAYVLALPDEQVTLATYELVDEFIPD